MPASEDRGNERAAGGEEAEEEVKTDGWLNTYADMVTLLFAFFVIMVALMSSDDAKMELFMMALSRDGLSAEDFYRIQEKYEELSPDDFDTWDDMMPYPGAGGDTPAEDKGGDAALEALYEMMNQHIIDNELGDVMALEFNGEYLLITLASDILFDSGMATLTDNMRESVTHIADMIVATFEPNDPFEIVVAGHTDNVPINTPTYPSNWYLSHYRATNYLTALLGRIAQYPNISLDPAYFYTRSCGEYRPIASNDTPEGRAANRRVEVMISLARANPRWHSDTATTDGSIPAPNTGAQDVFDKPLEAIS